MPMAVKFLFACSICVAIAVAIGLAITSFV